MATHPQTHDVSWMVDSLSSLNVSYKKKEFKHPLSKDKLRKEKDRGYQITQKGSVKYFK